MRRATPICYTRRCGEDDIDHCSPRIYWDLTTATVITMQLFEGVWCTDLLAALDQNDQAKIDMWREQGITPSRCGRLLFRSIILEQCYHLPGLSCGSARWQPRVFLPGGTLGYIDFGMVGWLDERQWAEQYRLFENIASERLHEAFEAMIDTLEPLNVRDTSVFETEFKNLLRDWMLSVSNPAATARGEKAPGGSYGEPRSRSARAGLHLPTPR